MKTIEELRQAADAKRRRAKDALSRQFGIPEGYSNGSVDQIVDDIVDYAILEIAIIHLLAEQQKQPQ